MKLISILILFSLVACMKYGTPGEPYRHASIIGTWQNTISGKVLDLSQLELNAEMVADSIISCNGNYGNAGKVNGIDRGNVELAGTDLSGLLLFGHLKYIGATDPACHDYSREVYEYTLTSPNTMTLCMRNYPYCFFYERGQ